MWRPVMLRMQPIGHHSSDPRSVADWWVRALEEETGAVCIGLAGVPVRDASLGMDAGPSNLASRMAMSADKGDVFEEGQGGDVRNQEAWSGKPLKQCFLFLPDLIYLFSFWPPRSFKTWPTPSLPFWHANPAVAPAPCHLPTRTASQLPHR